MDVALLIALLLVVVLGAGLWWWRRRAQTPLKPPVAGRSAQPQGMAAAAAMPRKPGHMIKLQPSCCAAARRIESAWYPDAHAPVLPLSGCDHPDSCKCQWMRVLDRRMTHRRVHPDRREDIRFQENTDRRSRHDRRKDSGDAWKDRS